MNKVCSIFMILALNFATMAMEKNFNPLYKYFDNKKASNEPETNRNRSTKLNLTDFASAPASTTNLDHDLLLISLDDKDQDRPLPLSQTKKILPNTPIFAKASSTPNIFSKQSKKKNILLPSEPEIRHLILSGNVRALKTIKDKLPPYIFGEKLSIWASRSGHDNLARALEPSTIFKPWGSAKRLARQIIDAKNVMFFGASYGDFDIVESGQKALFSLNRDPMNEELKTPSLTAQEQGYEMLAQYIKDGYLNHSIDMEKAILNQCLEINKKRILATPGDEKLYFLSWHFVNNAKDLIADQFKNSYLAWLAEIDFAFPIMRFSATQNVFVEHKLKFDSFKWKLIDRKNLLKLIDETPFTKQEREINTEKIGLLLENLRKGKTVTLDEIKRTVDDAITHGANLDAKFETKMGQRTAAEWAHDLGLKSLAFALNKHIWFLLDKEKFALLMNDDRIYFNLNEAMIFI